MDQPQQPEYDYNARLREEARVHIEKQKDQKIEDQQVITLDQAREILGENFIDAATCAKIHRVAIPERASRKAFFQMTSNEAEFARKAGHKVMLLVDKVATGKRFTVLSAERSERQYGRKMDLDSTDQMNLNYANQLIQYEEFATEPQPLRWVQTSVFATHSLEEDNLIDQLERMVLRNMLARENVKNILKAFREFEAKRESLRNRVLEKDMSEKEKEDILREVLGLKIVPMVMPTAVAAVQRIMTLRGVGITPPREQTIWTTGKDRAGRLIGITAGVLGNIAITRHSPLSQTNNPETIFYRDLLF